ncbi:MAG: FecR domain-containing protein, partial [Planctomycetaceae bacterium]
MNRPSDPATDNKGSQTEILVEDVAVLTHAVGAEWQVSAESLSAGSTLAPSMLRLRSGALLIEFFSGATVVLEGPAEFEILSKTRGHLLTGKLNAHVPPQAQGFTIKTSAGNIVDHGTDFGVNMATGVPDELHVFRGKVEVKSGGTSLDVETGEAIRLGSENPEVFDADRSAFLVEDDLIQQSRLASERRLDQWRNASSALSCDPATLYHLRLDGSHETTGTTRVLVNS